MVSKDKKVQRRPVVTHMAIFHETRYDFCVFLSPLIKPQGAYLMFMIRQGGLQTIARYNNFLQYSIEI